MLLGSAATLTAIASAQAADLPVKAKPVEYVKICSLYGEGFYYIPGSDICLKIGGYVQSDYGWNVSGARTQAYYGSVGGAQDRTVSPYSTRHRAHFNFDSRTQTAYGTLRTYVAVHVDNENQGTVTVNPTRAFIQWAGFTFGHTKSFTDVPGTPGDDGFRSLHQTQSISDTGANGTNQIAYTWDLGNGMTFNVGADEQRLRSTANLSNNITTVGADPTTSTHGMQFPTPWINFAVNQAWGRFGISAIFNENHATYYTGTLATTGACPTGQTGTSACGHPDDKWGWAVVSGIDIKAPFLGPGDHFGGYFLYSVGAFRYANTNVTSPGLFGGGNQVALGIASDSVFVNGGDLQLTTSWTVGAGWEHFWAPQFSTAWYGTYSQTRYNDTVVDNRMFCGQGPAVNQNIILIGNSACDPSFNLWTVGMVNNWYPVAGLRLAVDVLYTKVETAFDGQQISLNKAQGARPTGIYTAKDQGILSVIFRVRRSFATD
jgi:hypothetical protein